jgi:hypothetical protein
MSLEEEDSRRANANENVQSSEAVEISVCSKRFELVYNIIRVVQILVTWFIIYYHYFQLGSWNYIMRGINPYAFTTAILVVIYYREIIDWDWEHYVIQRNNWFIAIFVGYHLIMLSLFIYFVVDWYLCIFGGKICRNSFLSVATIPHLVASVKAPLVICQVISLYLEKREMAKYFQDKLFPTSFDRVVMELDEKYKYMKRLKNEDEASFNLTIFHIISITIGCYMAAFTWWWTGDCSREFCPRVRQFIIGALALTCVICIFIYVSIQYEHAFDRLVNESPMLSLLEKVH